MEKLLQRIPEEKIDSFLMVIIAMFLTGVVILLLYGALDILFDFGSNFEYWVQKVSIGLMTPGILLIAVGLLVFIGVNVEDLIR